MIDGGAGAGRGRPAEQLRGAGGGETEGGRWPVELRALPEPAGANGELRREKRKSLLDRGMQPFRG